MVLVSAGEDDMAKIVCHLRIKTGFCYKVDFQRGIVGEFRLQAIRRFPADDLDCSK
jgi:hypothetical protein